MFESAGRVVGVRIPDGQNAQAAPARTVLNAVECSMVAVEYGDEYGRSRSVVLLKVGDQLYFPPNAEAWTEALKPVNQWLLDGAKAKLAERSVTVPIEDSVDVIAAEMDSADDSSTP